MRLTTRPLTRATAWANEHPTTVFAMFMTVLALGPICLLLIGAWSLFFWPSPQKLIFPIHAAQSAPSAAVRLGWETSPSSLASV